MVRRRAIGSLHRVHNPVIRFERAEIRQAKIGSVSSSLLNVDVTSQPRRHSDQPVRHDTRQGGFDDLVEAGEDEGADANERGANERFGDA
jgi:hypothetical protein